MPIRRNPPAWWSMRRADAAGAWSALVECKLAAMEHGALHLSSADGPVLRAVPLPYALAEAT